MKNKGYWGTNYNDVISGTVVLSVVSIILSIIIIFKNYHANAGTYAPYSFMSFLLAVYLIANYCINYYLLIKKYSFIGSLKKFLYGFIPCVVAIILAIFAVVK